MRNVRVLLILEPADYVKEAVRKIVDEEGKNWGKRREAEFFYDREAGKFILVPADCSDTPSLPGPLLSLLTENRNTAERIDIDVGDIFAHELV